MPACRYGMVHTLFSHMHPPPLTHMQHAHTYTNVGERLSLPISFQAPLPPTGEPLG